MFTPQHSKRLWRSTLLVGLTLVGLALMGWAVKAQSTEAAGGLTVTILAAPNLVVDSNVLAPSTYAPSVATIAGKFCNTSGSPINNLTAYIGDYTGAGAEQGTPGVYPGRGNGDAAFNTQHPHLADGTTYRFTHVGGSTGLNDARRFIGTLAAGQCIHQYWHFTYPRRSNPNNTGNQPVWGATNNPGDDLWLNFDVWGIGNNGAATDNKTFKATMRNEISAMANKIVPNPDGVWFSTNTALVQPGGVITSNGILYTFGVVNQGFDNDGNFTPDFNAWAQPIGDPSYDPSCFRLIRTSGVLTISRSGGNPDMVITFVDQLYFQDLPHDNTGVIGQVHYAFMALAGPCSTALSPYQEAASGSDNEKFNGDYGIGVPPPVASAPVINFDKSGPLTAAAGARITYTMALVNPMTSTSAFGLGAGNVPPVITDTIPAGMSYVAGSAQASTSPVVPVTVRYSTDGGSVFTTTEPTPASSVTNLQWWMSTELPPGGRYTTTFVVTTPASFSGTPVFTNTACVQLDGGTSVACDSARTILTGNNTIGDFVWRDENSDGVQGAITTEAGIAGVMLTLYYDLNNNGILDISDISLYTTTTNASGFYSFTSVPNGNFLVVVDNASPNIPFGYNSTTSIIFPVRGLGTTNYPVGTYFQDADFGFGPVLILDKVLVQNNPAYEGENVTYTIRLTNTRPGNGTAAGGTCTSTYIAWGTSATATGNNWPQGLAGAGTAGGRRDGVFALQDTGGNVDRLYTGIITPAIQSGTLVEVRPVAWVYGFNQLDANDVAGLLSFQFPSITLGSTPYNGKPELNGRLNGANNQGLLVGNNEIAFVPNWAAFSTRVPAMEFDKSGGSDVADIFIDAVGWQITYTYACVPSTSDTLNPVPLTDTYDATRMQFVSATPLNNSLATGGPTPYTNTGLISWNNLGPIYPGGSKVVTVSFKVLEPHNNTSGTITNTASVFNARYADGRPANQVTDTVISDVGPASTIGDFIWRDIDGDGVQDGGAEVGIPGVIVNITVNSVFTINGVTYPANTVVTTTTDANGFYSFGGLRTSGAANVTVSVNTGSLPAGAFVNTGDPDRVGACTVATCNSSSTFSFNSATTNNDLVRDFGYQLPTLIAGTVWNDMNRNGVGTPDTAEPYLAGVVVELRDTLGNVISTTTTDANGYYEFSGPFNGNYNVVVRNDLATLGTGWTQSYDEDGTGTAHTVAVTVTTGGSSASNDFSYYLNNNASIGDTIYNDLVGNGVQDTGEPGLAGVRVWLYYDTNGDGLINPLTDALMMTQTTDANGNYTFNGLGATSGSANYLVLVDTSTLPGTDYAQSGDPDETGVCTICNHRDTGITLTAGQTYTAADFGYRRTGAGSIGDTIFRDTNGDGVQNLGETTLPNITVRLYISGVNVLTATSSVTGYYNFPGLPSGTYTVAVDTADPDIPTDPYGNRYIPTTSNPLTVNLATGQNYLDADFGFGPPGAIGDTVYWDFDQDGEQDYTDAGIPGVQVVLTNNTTVVVNGITYAPGTYFLTTTTNASGTYLFTGLNPATYTVRVVLGGASALPNTAVQTGDPDRTSACTLASTTYCDNSLTFPKAIRPGTIFMGADFGYRNTGVIGNFVFNDLDGDGFQDPGETGIPGVVVSLTNGSGEVLMTTTTSIDGSYVFTTAALTTSTTYNIVFGTPTGMVPVTNTAAALTGTGSVGNVIAVTLSSTGTVNAIGGTPCTDCGLYVDAGFRLNGNLSIGGTIFFDNGLTGAPPNGGTYVPGTDSPLSGTTVYLWSGSTLVAMTTTAPGGTYTFTNLPPGVYTVSTDIQTNTPVTFTYEPGWPTPATVCDATCNNWQPVTLTVSSVSNQDFGVYASMDCGDLPNTFGMTLLADGGACSLATGPRLGAARDGESNGQPNATATGDDVAGSDDEDGVQFGDYNQWTAGTTHTMVVSTTLGAGESAFIVAWFDWNRDGDFNDANERVLYQNVNNGSNIVTINIPAGYVVGPQYLDARFRIYSGTVASPLDVVGADGFADAGEVEDYHMLFTPTAVTLTSFEAVSTDRWTLILLGATLVLGVVLVVLARRQLRRSA